MSTSARDGYEYFITFIDDYLRYEYIYLMSHKPEAFEKFKEYKAEMDNHRGKSIKSLQSNRGGEYLLAEFRKYLEDHGITSQMSTPSQPQQNGVAERRNQILLDMVRSMMSYASLLVFFGNTHWKQHNNPKPCAFLDGLYYPKENLDWA